MNQCGENDCHLVTNMPNARDPEALKELKTFRKFSVKNTDKFFHFKYWVCDSEEIARKLKINTSRPGDVYLVRQANTPFN